MTTGVARETDLASCDDVLDNGSPDVFTNDLKTIRATVDLTTGHLQKCSPPLIICGSPTIFVNDKPMARQDDPLEVHCCPKRGCHIGYVAFGSDNVFADEGGDCDSLLGGGGTKYGQRNAARVADEFHTKITTFDAGVKMQDEESNDNGLAIYPPGPNTPANVAESVANGYDPNSPPPPVLDQDDEAASPAPSDPKGCEEVFAFWNSLSPKSFNPNNYDYELSEHYDLHAFTLSPAVSHYTIKAQRGLEEWEIVCNLQNLATNVVETLRTYIENTGYHVQLNSGFRHGSGTSQHEIGQAIDIQIPNYTLDQYWETAKWIKANLPYDQFILEYGGRMPWYHISFNREGNRTKLTTRTRPGVYKSGLIRVA